MGVGVGGITTGVGVGVTTVVVPLDVELVLPVAVVEVVPTVEVEPVAVVDGLVVIVVVVVEVVTVVFPGTHFPPERIIPNLLEQLLQATPLSLYVKENVPGGQADTHSCPLAISELPQLRQTFEGSTPTER